ncbi:MAG: phosphatase PAP2 family protein [Magnetococcales bacterium]|nr:phosphatase PAP2 family protein [Magnetococcales bacterium]
MTIGRSFAVTLALLIGVLVIADTTEIDLWVQDLFFHFDTGLWIINKDDPVSRMIFYTWAKRAVVLVGIAVFFAFVWTLKFDIVAVPRRDLIVLLLALVLVPTLISGLKSVTNVHCPWSLTRYGGNLPYVHAMDPEPAGFPEGRVGKCFPAGHPSGGFAFMVLFLLMRDRRWVGLGIGLTAGWVMGLYQMMKGAHFLSHVVITMLLAWLIILTVVAGVDHLLAKKPRRR